jgi:uncharacterized protein YoxC
MEKLLRAMQSTETSIKEMNTTIRNSVNDIVEIMEQRNEVLKKDMIRTIDEKIDQKHETFQNVYPEQSITPRKTSI